MSTLLTLLTGGGLAALGGLASGAVTNWYGAKRDRERYEREQVMALEARSHEQAMAREARHQEGLKQAYLELGTYLSRYLDWSKSVQPMLGPVPVPDPLPPQERWRIETSVLAYGSPEVRRLLDEWRKCAERIENADAVIRLRDQSRDPGQQFDDKANKENLALPEYRQAMFEADKAIRDRVHEELAGEV
jgi:type II secretory pathway pseudopilin PulG